LSPTNAKNHPVAAKRLCFEETPDRQLGCIFWFCYSFAVKQNPSVMEFISILPVLADHEYLVTDLQCINELSRRVVKTLDA
jgi:hypothetical protein